MTTEFGLFFKYGVMNGSKTANMLMKVHQLRTQNKRVIIIKPETDTRSDVFVFSRAVHSIKADIILPKKEGVDYLHTSIGQMPDYIFVDEAQFLSTYNVDSLRELSHYTRIYCYGLKTDYMSHLFEGSKRLIEISDTIDECASSTCTTIACFRNAIINAKWKDDTIIKQGSSVIDIGMEDKYRTMCWYCWDQS